MTVHLPALSIIPFFMVLARVGGLMVFAPFLGSGAIAPTIRIVFSFAFSIVLFPLVQEQVPETSINFLALVLLLAGELLIGMVLGFVGQLLLASLQIAGQVMGVQMGFGVINIIDPQTQVETPVLSILYNLIGILLFLSLNAHHWFIEAIVASYELVPGFGFSSGLFDLLMKSTAGMFLLAVQIAAPVVAILLIVDILIGIVGRMAPQIHVLIIGMPAKSLIGFIFLAATMHAFIPFVGRHISSLQENLY